MPKYRLTRYSVPALSTGIRFWLELGLGFGIGFGFGLGVGVGIEC